MYALSIGQAAPPFAIVVFDELVGFGVLAWEIEPEELPHTVFLAVLKLPQVQVAIGIDLHTLPELLVVGKLPLIDPAILVDVDAIPVPFLLLHLPEEDLIAILDQF